MREDAFDDAYAIARQHAAALPLAPRIVAAFARGDSSERAMVLREYTDGASFNLHGNVTDYIGTSMRDPELVELILGISLSIDSARAEAWRSLAVNEAVRGRWIKARAAFRTAERLEPTAPPILRALCAVLPFLAVPQADVEDARRAITRWDPDRQSNAAPGSSAAPALAPHLRDYLLGLLSSRLGEFDAALRHAGEIERRPTLPETRELVDGLAATVRADVLQARGRLNDALTTLEAVRGEIPLELMHVPGFGEDYARFLRADILYRLRRDADALRWLANGLPVALGSRIEVAYLAPFELRQAEIHERLGQRDRARTHYERFLRYWHDADPALQPTISAARERLARLD